MTSSFAYPLALLATGTGNTLLSAQMLSARAYSQGRAGRRSGAAARMAE